MIKKYLQQNKGYTLLFAVIVSSVVLGIGISILNLSKKEFLITTSARDSSSAFYAADTGIECAISADDGGVFDTTTNKTSTFSTRCNLPHSFDAVQTVISTPTPQEGVFVFHIKSGSADPDSADKSASQLAGKSCAVVKVTKTLISGTLYTIIDSRGYNLGWSPGADPSTGTCSSISPRRVERGIKYTY